MIRDDAAEERWRRSCGGVVLTVIRELKLAVELGAIVDRRVSLSTRADGRIDSRDIDPSPYFAPTRRRTDLAALVRIAGRA